MERISERSQDTETGSHIRATIVPYSQRREMRLPSKSKNKEYSPTVRTTTHHSLCKVRSGIRDGTMGLVEQQVYFLPILQYSKQKTLNMTPKCNILLMYVTYMGMGTSPNSKVSESIPKQNELPPFRMPS